MQKDKRKLMFKQQECKDICDIVVNFIFQANWKAAFCAIPGYIYVEPQPIQKDLYQVLKDGYLSLEDKGLVLVRKVNKYECEEHKLGKFLKLPNFRYRDEYPYDIKISVCNYLAYEHYKAYEDYKQAIELFKAKILNNMKDRQQINLLYLDISNQKRLHLSENKNQILISDSKAQFHQSNCLANVNFLYHWNASIKLKLNHFFEPENCYKWFIEFYPENKEDLVKLFSFYLNSMNIKIPFSIDIDADTLKRLSNKKKIQ